MPAGRRRRTPLQLDRKRALDKERQRLKRKSDKAKWHEMQNEVQRLRTKLDHIPVANSGISHNDKDGEASQLHRGHFTTNSIRHVPENRDSFVPEQAPEETSRSTTSSISSPSVRVAHEQDGTTLSQKCIFSTTCLCQPQSHPSYAECFEQTVFMALMEVRRLPGPIPSKPPIPLSPSLSDLLLMGPGGDFVTKVLNKVLKRPNIIKLPILLGAYLIVYRVLRYRFYPSLEAFNDIPEWLRPTDIQDSVPHPIFTDFVHFPQLRNAMALKQINYIREEFEEDYARCLCFDWPDTEQLLAMNQHTGGIILNPEFECCAFTLNSWSLQKDFVIKYPEAESMVKIKS